MVSCEAVRYIPPYSNFSPKFSLYFRQQLAMVTYPYKNGLLIKERSKVFSKFTDSLVECSV